MYKGKKKGNPSPSRNSARQQSKHKTLFKKSKKFRRAQMPFDSRAILLQSILRRGLCRTYAVTWVDNVLPRSIERSAVDKIMLVRCESFR